MALEAIRLSLLPPTSLITFCIVLTWSRHVRTKRCVLLRRLRAILSYNMPSPEQVLPPGFRSVTHSPTESAKELPAGSSSDGPVLYVCAFLVYGRYITNTLLVGGVTLAENTFTRARSSMLAKRRWRGKTTMASRSSGSTLNGVLLSYATSPAY